MYNELMIILFLHIMIAISSVAIATVTFFKPSILRVSVSYGFIVATALSGAALVITTPGTVLHACVVGLVYVTAVSVVTIATHVRIRHLSAANVSQR